MSGSCISERVSINSFWEGRKRGVSSVSVIALRRYDGGDWGQWQDTSMVSVTYFVPFLRHHRCVGDVAGYCVGWLFVSSRCWRNGCHWPVWKHGPRSLTYMRVFGWKTRDAKWKWRWPSHCGRNPVFEWEALSTDRSLVIDLSKSISVGTRKMVIYAWTGWSQGKLWWRLEAILTCKSFVWFGYRGERLIEPSSSWFPPKFPSG